MSCAIFSPSDSSTNMPADSQGLRRLLQQDEGVAGRGVDLKEELYTAIDPPHDKVVAALTIFKDIIRSFPRGGALRRVGDCHGGSVGRRIRGLRPRRQPQLCQGQRGPGQALGSPGQLRLPGEVGRRHAGRIRYLPWEFLVHVVDHKTPLDERQWALTNYLPRRVMIGSCYSDVPYDTPMYENEAPPKLSDQDYTLENIRKIGGVCAHQADFASRVGKSIGVPAAYVCGTAADGEGHAWVMWVELKAVTRTNITFSLESFGRYHCDHYYVGHLKDPQTGLDITDRQLELRLQTVGSDPQGKRQAALVMKAYPMLLKKAELDVPQQLLFLNQVIQFCPGNETVWQTLAKMFTRRRGGEGAKQTDDAGVDRLFATFAAVPDFTWTVFDDLIASKSLPSNATISTSGWSSSYEQAGRPDLACEGRLKYTDYLLRGRALQGCRRGAGLHRHEVPHDGRFVPKLLDKLDKVCKVGEFKDADDCLVRFYRAVPAADPPAAPGHAKPLLHQHVQAGRGAVQGKGHPDLAKIVEEKLTRLEAARPPRGG